MLPVQANDAATRDGAAASVLGDGRRVVIRPIERDDAEALGGLYAQLSSESRRYRFFHAHQVRRDESRSMASPEDQGGLAMIAVGDDDAIVGDARCVRTADTVASFAIAVRDDYQGVRLGSVLLDAIMTRAAAEGITTFEAEVLGHNDAMRRLLAKWPFAIVDRDGSSMVKAVFRTDGEVPGWPVDMRHPRVLVEERSWLGALDEGQLRDAGFSVVVCPGPRDGQACQLARAGRCRLVEDADAIVCSLTGDAQGEVLNAHQAADTVIPLFVTVDGEQPAPIGRALAIRRSGRPEELIDGLGRRGISPPP